MTHRQHEAATAALSEGYFEVPAGTASRIWPRTWVPASAGSPRCLAGAQDNRLEAHLETYPAPSSPLDGKLWGI